MKTITIDLDVYNYLVTKGLGGTVSASDVLRRELTRKIDIDDELNAYILSLAVEIGESASSILRRELGLASPAPNPLGGSVVEFRIRAGTNGGPWNSRDAPVLGVVGQTLRIFNDDSVPHRLHTPGQPFTHPAVDIAPGQSADFVLHDPFDSTLPAQSPIYDHDYGQSASFWIKVTAS